MNDLDNQLRDFLEWDDEITAVVEYDQRVLDMLRHASGVRVIKRYTETGYRKVAI